MSVICDKMSSICNNQIYLAIGCKLGGSLGINKVEFRIRDCFEALLKSMIFKFCIRFVECESETVNIKLAWRTFLSTVKLKCGHG